MDGDVKILEGSKWNVESEAAGYVREGYKVVSATSTVVVGSPYEGMSGCMPPREVIHAMILVKESD